MTDAIRFQSTAELFMIALYDSPLALAAWVETQSVIPRGFLADCLASSWECNNLARYSDELMQDALEILLFAVRTLPGNFWGVACIIDLRNGFQLAADKVREEIAARPVREFRRFLAGIPQQMADFEALGAAMSM